jgi:hypothetical protein
MRERDQMRKAVLFCFGLSMAALMGCATHPPGVTTQEINLDYAPIISHHYQITIVQQPLEERVVEHSPTCDAVDDILHTEPMDLEPYKDINKKDELLKELLKRTWTMDALIRNANDTCRRPRNP